MNLHIDRFLDRIKAAESRHQRDVVMTVAEARDLHSAITRLLLRLEEQVQASPDPTAVVDIEVRGRPFR
jgi:type II secretory pathway predicted ATPase ExeA